MRFDIAAFVLAGLIVAGCGSSPERPGVETGAGGGGQAAADAAAGGGGSAGVASQPVAPEGVPGSAEQFVVEVGDRVFFEFDSYRLAAEARETLEKQAAWLQRYPAVIVTVAGHADERGTREYNLALGERRANAIRDYLIALGVDSGRIGAISYGKERPVDPNSTEEAWGRNRRVVTMIDGGASPAPLTN